MLKPVFRGFYPDERQDASITVNGKQIRGQWVEGYFYKRNDGVCEISRYDADFDIERYTFEVIPETVGMFTGQHDMRGRKVFEHDTLRLWGGRGADGKLRREYSYPLPVVYCKTWCQFVVEDAANKKQFGFWQEFDAYEVVGTTFNVDEVGELNAMR